MRMSGRICVTCVNACPAKCLATNNQHGRAMSARGDPGKFVRARKEGTGSRLRVCSKEMCIFFYTLSYSLLIGANAGQLVSGNH
jgi:hypothetical protein